MARLIKWKTTCYYCKEVCDPVEDKKNNVHTAFLQRVKGKWYAQCYKCYITRNKENK